MLGIYTFHDPERRHIIDVNWSEPLSIRAQKMYANGYRDLISLIRGLDENIYIACPYFITQEYGNYISLGFKGKVKHQETLGHASVRELAEESGFIPDDEAIVQTKHTIFSGKTSVKEHLIVLYSIHSLIPNNTTSITTERDNKFKRVINIVYGSLEYLKIAFSRERHLLDNEDNCSGVFLMPRDHFIYITNYLSSDITQRLEIEFTLR